MAEAGSYDITVEQGAYWSLPILWKDEAGDPIDLTGYTARMDVRKRKGAVAAVCRLRTSEDADREGLITLELVEEGGEPVRNILLELEAPATSELPARGTDRRWYYDLELVPAGGRVRRVLEGRFVVDLEVTTSS